MTAPIWHRVELYAMRELHLFLLEKPLELALSLLLPPRLAISNSLGPVISAKVVKLYNNACVSSQPSASLPDWRQRVGIMRKLRAFVYKL